MIHPSGFFRLPHVLSLLLKQRFAFTVGGPTSKCFPGRCANIPTSLPLSVFAPLATITRIKRRRGAGWRGRGGGPEGLVFEFYFVYIWWWFMATRVQMYQQRQPTGAGDRHPPHCLPLFFWSHGWTINEQGAFSRHLAEKNQNIKWGLFLFFIRFCFSLLSDNAEGLVLLLLYFLKGISLSSFVARIQAEMFLTLCGNEIGSSKKKRKKSRQQLILAHQTEQFLRDSSEGFLGRKTPDLKGIGWFFMWRWGFVSMEEQPPALIFFFQSVRIFFRGSPEQSGAALLWICSKQVRLWQFWNCWGPLKTFSLTAATSEETFGWNLLDVSVADWDSDAARQPRDEAISRARADHPLELLTFRSGRVRWCWHLDAAVCPQALEVIVSLNVEAEGLLGVTRRHLTHSSASVWRENFICCHYHLRRHYPFLIVTPLTVLRDCCVLQLFLLLQFTYIQRQSLPCQSQLKI